MHGLLRFALPGFLFFAGALIATGQENEAEAISDIKVVFKTAKGDIHATIFATKAPISAANFLNLAKRGFYDGVGIHDKDAAFYLLTGDPTGTGRGMVGYFIENEIDESLKHDAPGVLSMARQKKPDTNGSLFFMTLAPCPHLDGLYSIFGKVTKGADLLPTLEVGDVIRSIEILDSTDLLFKANKSRIAEWNSILDMRKKLKE